MLRVRALVMPQGPPSVASAVAGCVAVNTDEETQEALVVRVWAEDNGDIRADFRTATDLKTTVVGRDRTLAAFTAWLDGVIADLR